jgi:hypothetical protein
MDEADKFNLLVDLEMFDAYRLKKVKDLVDKLKQEKESPDRPWVADAKFKNCVRLMQEVTQVHKINIPISGFVSAEIYFNENNEPDILSYSGLNWEEVIKQMETSDEVKAYAALVTERRNTLTQHIAELSAKYNVSTDEIAAEISFEMDFE